jgi:hypothetical protein
MSYKKLFFIDKWDLVYLRTYENIGEREMVDI